jgi:hypothetical protein
LFTAKLLETIEVDMGIMDRLSDLLKSYLNFDEDRVQSGFRDSRDPDLADTYDELNEFLHNGSSARRGGDWEEPDRSTRGNERAYRTGRTSPKLPPEELRKDFAELGVAFGADEETCKAARKKLLKIYHPDRYGGDEAAAKKALARSAGINAAYDNICKWRS